MRIVHAVLLPGIIVDVSNGILLHADAFREDETGVFAGRQLRTAASEAFEYGTATNLRRAQTSDGMESRAFNKLDDLIESLYVGLNLDKTDIRLMFSQPGIHDKLETAFAEQLAEEGSHVYSSIAEYLVKTFGEHDTARIAVTLRFREEPGAQALGSRIINYLHPKRK
uniref:Uncharacterized protein n=1 Tax=Peronospora matthiolae TaxID=2874970 RepID=A0AAV1VF89_9STRA